MTVYERIIAILDQKGVKYQALTHPPVKTCADAAKIRGTSPDQGAKALVCLANKRPIMVVLPCSRKLDFKRFKAQFGVGDLRLAAGGEVSTLTGLEIGSIPPIGELFGLPTYVDKSLADQEQIAFNAGDQRRSLVMSHADYTRLFPATFGDFSRHV